MADGKDGLWLVGRSLWMLEADKTWHWTWDVHGVFSTREKAAALCRDQNWFILPAVVDQPFPEDPCYCPGLITPNKTEAEPLRCKRSDLGTTRK